jgi:hypothetical protein
MAWSIAREPSACLAVDPYRGPVAVDSEQPTAPSVREVLRRQLPFWVDPRVARARLETTESVAWLLRIAYRTEWDLRISTAERDLAGLPARLARLASHVVVRCAPELAGSLPPAIAEDVATLRGRRFFLGGAPSWEELEVCAVPVRHVRWADDGRRGEVWIYGSERAPRVYAGAAPWRRELLWAVALAVALLLISIGALL